MIPPERTHRNDAAALRWGPYRDNPPFVQVEAVVEPPSSPSFPPLPEETRPRGSRASILSQPVTPSKVTVYTRNNPPPQAPFAPRPPRGSRPPAWARCCWGCCLLFLFLLFVWGAVYTAVGLERKFYDDGDLPYVFDHPVQHMNEPHWSEERTEEKSSVFGIPLQKTIYFGQSDNSKPKTSTEKGSEGENDEISAIKKIASIFGREKPSASPKTVFDKITSIFSDEYKPTETDIPVLPLSSPSHNPTIPLQIASGLPPGPELATFPIDGLIMSSPNDVFAHLINIGLLLYRSPIYNLPFIRIILVPQAFALQGLMDSQTLVNNGKRTPESDGVFKSLNAFINSLPATKNGVKIQDHDAALSQDLDVLLEKMRNAAAGKRAGWKWWGPYSGGDVHDELRSEYLRALKRMYTAVRYFLPLVTGTLENHKKFVNARNVYLRNLKEKDPRQTPRDSEIEALEQVKDDYHLSKKGLHAFWELSEGMMVGLRDWEERLKEVLKEENKVIKRFSKKTEDGGRGLETEILSLGHLIGWIQHSFMVERRYNEGHF